MRTIKPLTLTALNAPFHLNGKVRLVVVVGVMVSLDGALVEQEQTLWKSLVEVPGSTGALDEIKPKVRGEALLTGYAFPPGGKPAAVTAPRLAVGAVDKTIWVVGDRVWKASGPSEPVPYEKMPLGYDRAFGGQGFAANPSGKGFAPIKGESGDTVHPLPNLEIANKLITSPRERPAPAGFGPVDPSLPQRIKKSGTYDRKWLETRYPEMAEDLDPTYYNVAPDDQQIDGVWQGGERFVLENLHPDKPRLEGEVPRFRARAFATRVGAGSEGAFEEIGLRCDTLWFLPHLERVILLFRGGIEVADDDAPDLVDVIVGLEREGEPRSVEHYREVRRKRLDKDQGPLHQLRDGDLMPAELRAAKSAATGEMEALLEREGLMRANQRRRAQAELERTRERLRKAGVDPDKHLPKEVPPDPPTPGLNELADVVEDAKKQAETAQKEAEAQRLAAMERARALCKKAGIDFDKKLAEGKKGTGGPPKFRADAEVARLKGLVAQAATIGVAVPPAAATIDSPKFLARLRKAEDGVKEAYRRSAHLAASAEPLDAEGSARVRREVEATLAAGASLADLDLTGADLAGLDFSGRDLRRTFMEKANLRGCSFRAAELADAVLVRAELSGADLTGARAGGANLGGADLTDAKLGEADLTAAVLSDANLTRADFSGATLDKAQLSDVRCEGTSFARVRAKSLNLMKTSLAGADFREVSFTECNFLEVDLSRADFTGANLHRTAFVDVIADDAVFRGAKADKLRVVRAEKGSSMARCDLRGASLRTANMRGVVLTSADLRECDLSQADLSGCDLRDAQLEGSRAVEMRLVKADLTDANLARVDLRYALMGGAIVRGASFEEASVFRADAAKMKGDDRTSFKGANVTQVRVVPDRSTHG
jgi:uncharacterized protein YjbI with pentapeptide repeats